MRTSFCLALCIFACVRAFAQEANYDESNSGAYVLPELLVSDNGQRVTSSQQWEKGRRMELLRKFEQHVYGKIPGRPTDMHFEIVEKSQNAFEGKATRVQAQIYFDKERSIPPLNVLVYLPNDKSKVPVFMGMNFNGNHTVHQDPEILISDQYKALKSENERPERGINSGRWVVDELIANGFGVATAWYEELEADHKEGFKTGIRTTLARDLNIDTHEWGALAVWAWGLHRMVDFLETIPQVDTRRISLVGHSRLGKAALWAAANDTRFALIISNNSGEGGAALSRRNFGETVERINTQFPHWFIDKYKEYNQRVAELPVDQHMLLALMAPRPLYVASASEDLWADPKGEFLSAKHAGEVYKLYGKKGLDTTRKPEPDVPVGKTIAYHIRTGKHDITPQDWKHYINFATLQLK
jgi:hypothetical protein